MADQERQAASRGAVPQAAQTVEAEGQSEDEPEVLDLENPNFDIRSHDEMPASAVPQDEIDNLEFAADEQSQPALREW